MVKLPAAIGTHFLIFRPNFRLNDKYPEKRTDFSTNKYRVCYVGMRCGGIIYDNNDDFAFTGHMWAEFMIRNELKMTDF